MSILRKIVIDSKRDWDVKLNAALWAYRTMFKVTIQATPFSLVYGIEATLPIEFEVESLRVAVVTRLNDSESLKNRLGDLEELDEKAKGSSTRGNNSKTKKDHLRQTPQKDSITTRYVGYASGWEEEGISGKI